MSYYRTRSDNVKRDYVVIRHGIPNVNSMVMGVKFRNSWAVVEKNSKLYHKLKMLPMLKNPQEKPLTFLKDLPFITRAMDVKLIYGADVYAKYVKLITSQEEKQKEEQKVIEIQKHIENPNACKFILASGEYCRSNNNHPEVSSYCAIHLLNDPRLQKIDFKIPTAMDKKERKKVKKTAFNKLKQLSKAEEKVNVSVDKEKDSTIQIEST